MKNKSPFVKTVVVLDDHFSELERLSQQIEKMDLSSEFQFERVQQLMNRFTECGGVVSVEIASLAQHLNESRERAEAAASIVSAKAEQMLARKNEIQKKMEEFRQLGEKVRSVTLVMNDMKSIEGKELSEADRARISMKMAEFEVLLQPLIDEARQLQKDAQSAKMRALERDAESLGQSLTAASQKLHAFHTLTSEPM